MRSQFAKRLKIIRTQRGFDRARYFAKSLGIEENRYTRYERAEVEPSLTLIHKMCATLHVTPNELLGFAEFNDEGAFQTAPGLAEVLRRSPPSRATARRSAGSLAWRLASEAIAIRGRAAGPRKAVRRSARQLPRDGGAVSEAADRAVRHGRRDRRRLRGENRRPGPQDGHRRPDPRFHRERQRQGRTAFGAVVEVVIPEFRAAKYPGPSAKQRVGETRSRL